MLLKSSSQIVFLKLNAIVLWQILEYIMEITGKIIKILPAASGTSARGEWKRQDFILETQDQFPKKVCISNWNDKVDINNIPQDTIVTASVNIESREFNERWYTDVKVWKITTGSSNANAGFDSGSAPPPPPLEEPPEMESSPDDDLPF
jgi:hypothetical protein